MYYFLLPVLYLISLLPFRALYLLSDLLAWILYAVAGYRKKVVIENLRNAFPERTAEELHSIARDYYTHLADLLVESIKMLSISEKSVRRRITIMNPEFLEPYYRDQQSLLAVGTHYANWEWGGLALSLHAKHTVLGVYKPLSNKRFDERVKKMRSRFGTVPVPMKGLMRKLIEFKGRPTITVLISDQTPSKGELQYWTSFLNQPTPVFLGVEKLARETGYPVIYCDMQQVKRGYYTIRLMLLSNKPGDTSTHELTEKHVRLLEKVIRQKPEHWLWSHRRWKHKPPVTAATLSE